MVKLTIKAYIDKYDVQGTPTEIETDEIESREDWLKIKQKTIKDFIDNFGLHFRKKYNEEFESFGKGFYKDNKLNRKLKRVGKPYDKGAKLRDKLAEIIRNRNISITNEGRILEMLEKPLIEVKEELRFKRRRWLSKEIELLKELREKGLTFKQIGLRLYRSEASTYQKYRRVKNEAEKKEKEIH